MTAPKAGQFTLPTGATGNVFSISSMWSLILGVFVLLLTFALGQNLARKVSGAVPVLDTTVEQPWQTQVTPTDTNRKWVA